MAHQELSKYFAVSSLCTVICAGLPRSGSTWAYNVALTLSHHMRNGVGIYTDSITLDFFDSFNTGFVVLKTHSPDEELTSFILADRKPIILSVRDPRDCVCSLMSQFRFNFDQAAEAVILSVSRLNGLAKSAECAVFRYESAGARGAKSILKIASLIGANCSSQDAVSLARSLKPIAIKRKIEQLQQSGVIDAARPESYEPSTHWHPNHIGDGAVGKYANALTAEQSEGVYAATREFCSRHGYAN